MNKFDLIIFDCDGVLVDSERLANQVFADVLNRELGFSLSLEEMFDQFVGHSPAQCLSIIEKMLGSEPPHDLEAKYQTEINDALKQSVEAVTGIETALAQIDTPYCVASNGSYEKMATTLGKTKLLRFFEGKLFSTSDVENGKPFPDIYLHAAKKGRYRPIKVLSH